MRRLLSLLAAVIMATALTLVSTGSASALGGEWLGCRIVPATGNPPFNPTCANRTLINGTYSAGFHVFNTSGSYSVSWTLPAGYPAAFGCGADTFDCSINMSSRFDQDAIVFVTLTQGGASVTLSARAHINAVCGSQLC
jgi:hypothetical protein